MDLGYIGGDGRLERLAGSDKDHPNVSILPFICLFAIVWNFCGQDNPPPTQTLIQQNILNLICGQNKFHFIDSFSLGNKISW